MLVSYLLGRVTDRDEPILRQAITRRLSGRGAPIATALATIVIFQVVYVAVMAPGIWTKSHHLDTTHIHQRVYPSLPNQPL
jgi:hypothetical protein